MPADNVITDQYRERGEAGARHPLALAGEARVLQEVAGEGRFRLGLGASKILMNSIGAGRRFPARPRAAMKETIEILRPMPAGEEVDFEGREFSAKAPAMSPDADAPDRQVPIYVAATGPRIQELSGEMGDGLLTAALTTPEFMRYSVANLTTGAEKVARDPETIDVGATLVTSIDEHDSDAGRAGAREITGMYIANKVQNIQGSADILLEKAELSREEALPIAEAVDRGGRKAAAAMVTDEILDTVKPIAGTPSQCIEAIEEYHDAGCTHVMLELWGEDRAKQFELFGTHVLPHFH
jgi:5,10-methylenetetrahydromethanopterin reductase